MRRPVALEIAGQSRLELVPPGPDTVPATVVTASFLGGEASDELSCAGQLMHATAAMARGAGLQAAGAAVGLRTRDGAVRVLADEQTWACGGWSAAPELTSPTQPIPGL